MKFHVTKVSILQVASKSHFFIFDLLQLQNYEEFGEFITEFMQSQEILKVGMGFRGDLERLISSYPNIDGFRSISNYIELKTLYLNIYPDEYSTSLANVALKVLGNESKPV